MSTVDDEAVHWPLSELGRAVGAEMEHARRELFARHVDDPEGRGAGQDLRRLGDLGELTHVDGVVSMVSLPRWTAWSRWT